MTSPVVSRRPTANTVLSLRSICISAASSFMSPYCTAPLPNMKAESRRIITIESDDEKSTGASRSVFTYRTRDCDAVGNAGTTSRESSPTVSVAITAGTRESSGSAGVSTAMSGESAPATRARCHKAAAASGASSSGLPKAVNANKASTMAAIYIMRALKLRIFQIAAAKIRKKRRKAALLKHI